MAPILLLMRIACFRVRVTSVHQLVHQRRQCQHCNPMVVMAASKGLEATKQGPCPSDHREKSDPMEAVTRVEVMAASKFLEVTTPETRRWHLLPCCLDHTEAVTVMELDILSLRPSMTPMGLDRIQVGTCHRQECTCQIMHRSAVQISTSQAPMALTRRCMQASQIQCTACMQAMVTAATLLPQLLRSHMVTALLMLLLRVLYMGFTHRRPCTAYIQ